MKTKIIDINGKESKEIELPKSFSSKIRRDVILKVIETKKRIQPYAPSPIAGKQQSDRGKIRHRRHVWQTHYGRGMSRVPRKVMSRRGTQFNWEASGVPHVKGGPRAHPPKVISMVNSKKINKKELKVAFESALSATINKKIVSEKYKKIEEKDLKHLPLVFESKIKDLKTKEFSKLIKDVLGDKLIKILSPTKKQRAGIGKIRGRRYKKSAGMLIVSGEKEKLKTKLFEAVNTQELSTEDLARGGLGRFVVFTEQAIKDLEKRK